MPGGGDPSWITQGTYMSDREMATQQADPYDSFIGDQQLSSSSSSSSSSGMTGMAGQTTRMDKAQLGGILRSNLANEEFIQWLPETMLAFAEQTGAGVRKRAVFTAIF